MFWLQAGIWDGFGNHFQTVVGIYLAGAVYVGDGAGAGCWPVRPGVDSISGTGGSAQSY